MHLPRTRCPHLGRGQGAAGVNTAARRESPALTHYEQVVRDSERTGVDSDPLPLRLHPNRVQGRCREQMVSSEPMPTCSPYCFLVRPARLSKQPRAAVGLTHTSCNTDQQTVLQGNEVSMHSHSDPEEAGSRQIVAGPPRRSRIFVRSAASTGHRCVTLARWPVQASCTFLPFQSALLGENK
jgi:hypothetical protein